MNTVQLRYSKRIVPVQYEYEELEITFGVDSDSNLVSRTNEMKAFVNNTLYGKTQSTISSSTSGASNGQEIKQESSNEKTSSKKSRTKSEEKVTAAAEVMEEVESPFKETVKEAIPSETKTAKATTKEKTISYDRENPDHRSTMSNFLVKLTGGKEWSKDKEKSKKASAELTGKPFLDTKGEILESFKELCKEKFGVTTDDTL